MGNVIKTYFHLVFFGLWYMDRNNPFICFKAPFLLIHIFVAAGGQEVWYAVVKESENSSLQVFHFPLGKI